MWNKHVELFPVTQLRCCTTAAWRCGLLGVVLNERLFGQGREKKKKNYAEWDFCPTNQMKFVAIVVLFMRWSIFLKKNFATQDQRANRQQHWWHKEAAHRLKNNLFEIDWLIDWLIGYKTAATPTINTETWINFWTPCRLTTVQDSSPLNSQLEENCCTGRWKWAQMKTNKQAGPADRWHQRCLSGGGLRTRIQSKLPVLLTTSAAGRSQVEMSAVSWWEAGCVATRDLCFCFVVVFVCLFVCCF